jgi:prophage regulatory protein
MIAANDNEPIDELLRLRDVTRITKLCNSSVYNKIREGTFPRPLQLSPACVRWRTSAIRAWLNSLTVTPARAA